jgi:hypothetical protein
MSSFRVDALAVTAITPIAPDAFDTDISLALMAFGAGERRAARSRGHLRNQNRFSNRA